jgi:nicotinate-nucleotide adenylyltransferase
LNSLHKWKNFTSILENHNLYIYPRISKETEKLNSIIASNSHYEINRIDAPIVEISSTFIRDGIKNKKNIRPLLSEKVWDYIDHNNLYRK